MTYLQAFAGGQGQLPNTEYVYDEENRLIEVKLEQDSVTTTLQKYAYDALGRRIETIDYSDPEADDPLGRTGITEIKTRHIYSGLETIEEYVHHATNGWTLVREFIWGGGFPELLAMIDRSALGDDATLGTPEVLYTLHDPLGSVIGLVNDSGRLVEKVHYDPYGQTYFECRIEVQPGTGYYFWTRTDIFGDDKPWGKSAYGNPFLWTGQRYDAGVELYAFLYRTYSPRLGRWLQRDPMRYIDGVSLYQYVAGAPLRFIDALGLIKRDCNGHVIFKPKGPPVNVTHPGNGGTPGVLQPGEVQTDDGTPIDAYEPVPGSPNADKFKTDCHGQTFCDGEMWVNNNQVGKVLHDEYNHTDKPKKGDVIIYRYPDGSVAHSATVTSVRSVDISMDQACSMMTSPPTEPASRTPT